MDKIDKLKELFEFNDNKVLITVPVRDGKCIGDATTTELKNRFITFDEVKSLFEVQKILNLLNKDNELYDSNNNDHKNKKLNDFIVGGPLANKKLAQLFRKYFKGFKFGVPKKSAYLSTKNYKLDDLVFDDLTPEDRDLKINDDEPIIHFYEKDGYIILLKLSADDFDNPSYGTIHACFGNSSATSLNASKIYLEEIDFLYEKLKNRKHYFVYIGCEDNYPNIAEFKDLSNYYFKD